MSDTREAVGADHLDYSSLLPFVDIICGAVYGYGAYEVAKTLEPFVGNPPSHPEWGRILLLLFVANYFTADSAEARVYNEMFGYRGRARFLLDMGIAAAFLFAFMAAAGSSVAILIALGVAFLLGAWWSVHLELETRDDYRWAQPRLIILSHVCAGVACFACYGILYAKHIFILSLNQAWLLWGFYFLWLIGLVIIRKALGITAAEADMLPVGLVHAFLRVCARAVVRGFRFIRGQRDTALTVLL